VQTRHRLQAAPARSPAGADGPSEPSPRDDARVLVLAAAALVFTEGQSAPWSCAVRDLSHGGARLELDPSEPPRVSEQLPELVLLFFCPDRTEVECRIAWREGRHFGVQFTSELRPSSRLPA
jgi:PilZ domain